MKDRYLLRPGAHGRPDARHPCIACGKVSTFVASIDRFVHNDGSSNRECWREVIRGRVYPSQHDFDDWYLPASQPSADRYSARLRANERKADQ